jgi:hypothetical protein
VTAAMASPVAICHFSGTSTTCHSDGCGNQHKAGGALVGQGPRQNPARALTIAMTCEPAAQRP